MSLKIIGTDKDRSAIYDILLVFFCNFIPKIFDFKIAVTLKSGSEVIKVIERSTIRYIGYDFLLVFYNIFVTKTPFLRYSTSKML